MNYSRFTVILSAVVLAVLAVTCSEKNPPRDEIPRVKDTMARLEEAIKSKNPNGIDSLMSSGARRLGYSPEQIMTDVCADTVSGSFYTFGKREFFYTKDKAMVRFRIMIDSSDTGRPAEITLVKDRNQWLVKRFDLR
ncbi:MAG: hypothetical protein JSU69_05045 [Candidatus Zixiibacteriota bacterium]|nr:MAG: hypothetical protein JSU69_05045 [candidate division Zixibacteria bacterium]